jgi:hypothetical protein
MSQEFMCTRFAFGLLFTVQVTVPAVTWQKRAVSLSVRQHAGPDRRHCGAVDGVPDDREMLLDAWRPARAARADQHASTCEGAQHTYNQE